MSSWNLRYSGFEPSQEALREALCVVGNGYVGTRGAACELSSDRIHYPGTYLAGVYNTLGTKISGRVIYNEDLVNCPNWLCLKVKSAGVKDYFCVNEESEKSELDLDMKTAVFQRNFIAVNSKGHRVEIREKRFASMNDPHMLAIQYEVKSLNYSGEIIIESALDGNVENANVARYRDLKSKHIAAGECGEFSSNGLYLSVMTKPAGETISVASKLVLTSGSKTIRKKADYRQINKKCPSQTIRYKIEKGRRIVIEKIVSIYTSRDKGLRSPKPKAITAVKKTESFKSLYRKHAAAWKKLWKKFDIQVEGDDFAQQVFRLHTLHLLQSASIHNRDLDAGVLARGLHGESYRGHIFWDELFVMPFYDFHEPEASKALLMYRYRRLKQAREYARENGYCGAMFPWQSGSSGKEETQVIHLNPLSGKWDPDFSCIQRHVSFDIAYNVFQYWKRTGDKEFLSKYGAELMFSVSLFASSLAEYEIEDEKYHTYNIMGPDEFHEKMPGSDEPGLTDNAYTNFLIAWLMQSSLEIRSSLDEKDRKRLDKRLGITDDEVFRWKDISENMNIVFNEDGIISQFDGYFGLKELDWDAYRKKYDNIHRMDRILKAEGKTPNDYKVAKQADALMIFYLFPLKEIQDVFNTLGYKFNKKALKANYDYYVDRTSHGSTLSKVVHCYVAHTLGRTQEAWQWYEEVLRSDIYDTQGGTTPEGIHTGVMAGSLYMVMRAFAGVTILDDRIEIGPKLPRKWKALQFSFDIKGVQVGLHFKDSKLSLSLSGRKAKDFNLPFIIKGRKHKVVPGKVKKVSF